MMTPMIRVTITTISEITIIVINRPK
jgi:hypothetical protein